LLHKVLIQTVWSFEYKLSELYFKFDFKFKCLFHDCVSALVWNFIVISAWAELGRVFIGDSLLV